MLADVLKELYERDLNKLTTEIEQFENEADLWKTSGAITNSAGNLCQHLTGNLQHFLEPFSVTQVMFGIATPSSPRRARRGRICLLTSTRHSHRSKTRSRN